MMRADAGWRRWFRVLSLPAVAVALAMLSSGVAAASWLVGDGDGEAVTGTTVVLTTAVTTASTTSLLYPSGPAAALKLTVQNPNRFPVSVTAVAGNGVVTATGGSGTCTVTGITVVTPSSGLPFTVPAKVGTANGSVTATVNGGVQMSAASDAGCQGATFTIPVSLTGVSAAR